MGKHYEQLTAEERAAIMMMKTGNCSARHMARTLHRAPSTITRELGMVFKTSCIPRWAVAAGAPTISL